MPLDNTCFGYKIFFARGRLGGAVPPNVNLGPPIISETTRVRKLKLKTPLEVVKYLLLVQKIVSARGNSAVQGP